jgi:tetratricopeptide (TPR) repeat protein
MTAASPARPSALRALGVLASVAVFAAGCATAKPAPVPAPEPAPAPAPAPAAPTAADKAAAALAALGPLVEKGTADSLDLVAAAFAQTGDDKAGAAAGAPALAAVAGLIEARVYPDRTNPFPAPSAGAAQAPAGVSVFLQKIVRGLDLPVTGAPASADDSAALDADLAAADALNSGASVLPPYLRSWLVDASHPADQRAFLAEALRRDPGFSPAAVRLSGLLLDAGAAKAELPLIEKLAASVPSAPTRFSLLARAYLQAGQPQKAADAAAQGLLAAPDQPSFAVLRARALRQTGDWYQALRVVEALLKIAPDTPEAVSLEAEILYEDMQNANEALALLADAETRFPQDASFPELRGTILMDAGLKDQAAQELQKALALDPSRLDTLTTLLDAAVSAAAWSDAEGYLAKIPAASRTPDILRSGWQVEEGLGSHDQAVAYARALAATGAADEGAEKEIRSLLAAGRPADALALIDTAVAAAKTPGARSTFRTLRAAAGSTDPMTDLRRALLDDPDNVEALVAITTALEQQGDLRKAAEYARHAAELSPRDPSLAGRAADLAAKAGAGN